jgi:hypothetical protein
VYLYSGPVCWLGAFSGAIWQFAATGISAAADAAKIKKNSFLVNVRFSSLPWWRLLIAHIEPLNVQAP